MMETQNESTMMAETESKSSSRGFSEFSEAEFSPQTASFLSGFGEAESQSSFEYMLGSPTRYGISLGPDFMESQAIAEKEAKAHAKEVFCRYSTPCHVGNWYEQMCALEATQAARSELYRRGRTSGQKAQVALKYMNEPITVHPDTSPNVAKSLVQIVSRFEHSLADRLPKKKLVVSATMTEDQLADGQTRQINALTDVGLYDTLSRVRRNIFCFLRADPHYLNARILHYNTPYFIRLLATGPKPRYLRCVTRNIATVGLYGGNLPITIAEEPDRYCLFHVGPVHECEAYPRDTSNFKNLFGDFLRPTGPVKTCTPVTICHTMSNHYLTISKKMVLTKCLGEAVMHASCGKRVGKFPSPDAHWILKTSDTCNYPEIVMSAGDQIR